MSEPNNGAGYTSFLRPEDQANEFNLLQFQIWQVLSRINTAAIVKVVACSNSGGLSPVGTVDVQPLVAMIDGNGNTTPHGVIYKCPYFRLQGGANAVIIDPAAGDIGIMIFADRDSSIVKTAKKASPPGSRRMFDMSDGIYIGGILNGTPTQYMQFQGSGVTITSPLITLNGPVQVNGDVAVTGAVAATLDITALTETTSLSLGNFRTIYNEHTHGDPQGGSTGTPSVTI